MAQLVGEAWHYEQRRRSRDRIRVYNPLETDYILRDGNGDPVYDFKFTIPSKDKNVGFGNGIFVLERYLAEKYRKEMTDKLIFSDADRKLQEVKNRLTKEGNSEANFYANNAPEVMNYRSDDPTKIRHWYKIIWLGVESFFGREGMAGASTGPEPETDSMEEWTAWLDNIPYREQTVVASPAIAEKSEKKVKHDLTGVAA